MNEKINPLVSVIIPFFNVKAFLAETIESVFKQDYSNWEIILIDDGSTDGSTEVAEKYVSESDGKVIYTQHEGHKNRGAAASRNLGVSQARGEWLAFLDADDFWLPSKLREQVELLQDHPEATVLCEATTYWYSWCNPHSKDLRFSVGAKEDKLYHPPDLTFTLYPLGKGHSFCTCGLIMKTERFRAIGGFDETFIGKDQLYEDQVLFFKICLHETVYISSKCNNLYRQRPDSLMHGLLSEGYYMQGRYYFLQWLIKYLQQENIRDKRTWKLVKKALWPYQHPRIFKLRQLSRKVVRRLNSYIKRR